jgi:hypothetical protein
MMRARIQALLTLGLAMSLAFAGSSPASASRAIEFTITGGERSRSTALTFTNEEATFAVICELSLVEELERRIEKSVGAVIGDVISATMSNCREGRVRLLGPEVGRPWRITYVSFTGTLPSITSLRREIRGFGLLLETFFGAAQCLYGGNLQDTTTGNPIREVRMDERVRVPLIRKLGVLTCPTSGIFRGTASYAATVTMRLT